jgi:hypothetical protein
MVTIVDEVFISCLQERSRVGSTSSHRDFPRISHKLEPADRLLVLIITHIPILDRRAERAELRIHSASPRRPWERLMLDIQAVSFATLKLTGL